MGDVSAFPRQGCKFVRMDLLWHRKTELELEQDLK